MAKKYMKNLMLVIIELSILIPMELQANDYVQSFLLFYIALHFPSTIFTLLNLIHIMAIAYYLDVLREKLNIVTEWHFGYLNCIEFNIVMCIAEASKDDPIYYDVKRWMKICNKKLSAGKIDHVATCLKMSSTSRTYHSDFRFSKKIPYAF